MVIHGAALMAFLGSPRSRVSVTGAPRFFSAVIDNARLAAVSSLRGRFCSHLGNQIYRFYPRRMDTSLPNTLEHRSETTPDQFSRTQSPLDGLDEITDFCRLYFSLSSEEIVERRRKMAALVQLQSRTPDKWFIYLNRRFHSPSPGELSNNNVP